MEQQQYSDFFKKNERKVLFAITAIILAIIIGIGSIIVNLRIFQDNDGEPKYSMADSFMYKIRCNGQRAIRLREMKPNQTKYRFPNKKYDDLEYKEYKISSDSNGFIKPSFIHEKPDIQIFFIGGSTTENEFVDEELRFPYLVGRMLEERMGKPINSDNGARNGNNSIHSINILLNKIAPYHPDVVVMMHNINDLTTLMHEGTYWNYNPTRSNLSCALKNSDENRTDEWSNSEKRNYDDAFKSKIMQEFKENMQLFVNIARSKKITPVLMTQSNRIENNDSFEEISITRGYEFAKVYQELYGKFNQIIRDVAAENNVMLIDLAKLVPQDKKYIYDEVHVNNEGSKLTAEIISDKLYHYFQSRN